MAKPNAGKGARVIVEVDDDFVRITFPTGITKTFATISFPSITNLTEILSNCFEFVEVRTQRTEIIHNIRI